ncbi:protein NinF [[Erwinia] mediterraneensis]|uniref:protein NinF n=1 Tax=[Erwinia] mediterraneensis TaxID=2161819 RepID=UPI00102FBDEB
MKKPKVTSSSSRRTGSGEPSALVCVGCGIRLKPSEVYACAECLDLWTLTDPHFDMTGGDDE